MRTWSGEDGAARGRSRGGGAPPVRLMRDMGLHGVRRAKSPRTTRSAPRGQCPADLVNRHFAAFRPNELWVSDITYVRTFGGWVRVALNHRRALQADRGLADLHEPGRLFRGWS